MAAHPADIQQSLRQGLAAHRAGRLDQARALYEQVLEIDPHCAEAWHFLALLAQGSGALAEALGNAQKAVQAKPGYAEALVVQGDVLGDLGRLDEAVEAYRQALGIYPDFAEALANLGNALRRLGRPEDAIEACRLAIGAKPELAQAHNNLGAALLDLGLPEEAEEAFRRALALDPGLLSARLNLGEALRRRGQIEAALEVAGGAATGGPPDGSPGGSSSPALHNLMGNIKLDLGDFDGAAESYAGALALDPDDLHAHNNFGNLLVRQGRLDEAVLSYRKALAIKPDFADALANLGAAHQARGRLDLALQCCEEALAIDADHADAHWNRGIARLLDGDLAGGLADYEWRWRLPEFTRRAAPSPLWEGQDVDGKTILLQSEQGFGDTIQFVRLAEPLARLGARVVIETHQPLLSLIASAAGVERVVQRGVDPGESDFHLPLLSLAHRLGLTLQTIPAVVPYLAPPPGQGADLGIRAEAGPRLGIAWAGRPTHKNDANRSTGLDLFRPLAEIPGVALYSLQLGQPSEDLGDIHDLAPRLDDFAETARAVKDLDLVISVDTALAHLAGALGRPVWVLLPFAPDWRWLRDRNDTPWYPSMRLFRQPAPGDWESVFSEVATALGSWALTARID